MNAQRDALRRAVYEAERLHALRTAERLAGGRVLPLADVAPLLPDLPEWDDHARAGRRARARKIGGAA